MLRYFFIFIFFTYANSCLLGNLNDLTKKNIHESIEEFFKYHVEYKELSPLLVKRSFRLFFEQFDPLHEYLLEAEVAPFWNMKEKELQAICLAHKKKKYEMYEKASKLARLAVKRARIYRGQIRKDILLGRVSLEKDIASFFPKTEEELKEKITSSIIAAMKMIQQEEQIKELSHDCKVKILDLLERRAVKFEESYVSTKKEHFFALHVLKALAKSLDAHTSFFTQEEALDLRASLERQFEGIGVVLREGINGIVVKEVVEGGPAYKSGKINIGDLLVEVEGKNARAVPYEEVMYWLKAGGGNSITISVQKANGRIDVVALPREKIIRGQEMTTWQGVPYGDGIIGVIEIPAFYESKEGRTCEKDVKEALHQLRRLGEVKGLLLDLRNNSGGFLHQAVKVAGLFISSGVIVISQYAEGQKQYLREIDGRVAYVGPLVVLTSKASASAAEIVAQALQDYGLAVVVGDERTYGKGTIQYQTVTDPKAETFFKVTVGKYYTVSGRSTQIEGVKADIVVPSKYFPFNIGEKYLLYALKNDQVASSYLDELIDVEHKKKEWMQKNYLPNLQKKLSLWGEVLPVLQANSAMRLKYDKNFLSFLDCMATKAQPVKIGFALTGDFGVEDLQVIEGVNILKDMTLLERHRKK